ncbi:MAG: hypothetical protein ACKVZ0_09110 [Gemmatimonadales bacterium]
MAAGCSGLIDNADGISSIDVRLPVNFYLEVGRSVTLHAVARNANGDSVAAEIQFLTPDTTITVGQTTGVITGARASGTGRVQVVTFGTDTVLTRLDSLKFTLTAAADTMVLVGADSVEVRVDETGTNLGVRLDGGSPAAPVAGRPITFTLIEPAAADSTVILPSGRAADSVVTTINGTATLRVRGRSGKTIPDRAVVEINAYRADGQRIPGSSRRVVIRFLHQTA